MAGIFNSAVFNNQIFNTGAHISPDTHDGFGGSADDWKEYRKRLTDLSEASEKFLESKYVREEIQEKILEIEKIDEEVKELVLGASEENSQRITAFYRAFSGELGATKSNLKAIITKRRMEEDAIHALLLSGDL